LNPQRKKNYLLRARETRTPLLHRRHVDLMAQLDLNRHASFVLSRVSASWPTEHVLLISVVPKQTRTCNPAGLSASQPLAYLCAAQVSQKEAPPPLMDSNHRCLGCRP